MGSWWTRLKKILSSGNCGKVSRVTITYDSGWGNTIYIRGEGGGLSWEKGIAMVNVTADVWEWKTCQQFDIGSFKVLINDAEYESGENHVLIYGGEVRYSPKF